MTPGSFKEDKGHGVTLDIEEPAVYAHVKINSSGQASSSIGRAAVSKTAGWGFDSLLACHLLGKEFFSAHMNTKVDTSPGILDTLKLVLAAVALIGGVVAYYYYEDESLYFCVWQACWLLLALVR